MFKREIVVNDKVYTLYKPMPWYRVKDDRGREYHVFKRRNEKIAVHVKAVLFDIGDIVEFSANPPLKMDIKICKYSFWLDGKYCGLPFKVVLFEDVAGGLYTFEFITQKSIREKTCKHYLL